MELDWETVAGTLKQQNWLNHVEQKSYLGPVGRVKRTTAQSNGFKSGSPKTPTIKSPYLIFMSFTCIYIYKYVCMSMSVYILYIYVMVYWKSTKLRGLQDFLHSCPRICDHHQAKEPGGVMRGHCSFLWYLVLSEIVRTQVELNQEVLSLCFFIVGFWGSALEDITININHTIGTNTFKNMKVNWESSCQPPTMGIRTSH